mgnify:CR=1 FL=1
MRGAHPALAQLRQTALNPMILGALAGFLGGRLGAPKAATVVAGYDARRV